MRIATKIYFLGSGAFAVPVLEALAAAKGIELAGIGTQPDRPARRKRILTPTPLGHCSDALGLKCDRVSSVNSPDFIAGMKRMSPDMLVVVSFGQLLKREILGLPPLGCLNVHASLLPRHRGASPIATAILEGDAMTGVCFMRMDKGLDTGPVYSSHSMSIAPDATTPELEAGLADLAATHIVRTIQGIADGSLAAAPQPEAGASLTKKIRKGDGVADWTDPAELLERKVRAFTPWPGVAFSILEDGKSFMVKITDSEVVDDRNGSPGELLETGAGGLLVACGRGAIRIKRLIPEGKRDMSAGDFLRGRQLSAGQALGGGH